MRHRKAGRKFDTNAPHRKAMFRNMVTSLMVHGRIKTTKQRAKELRKVAERVITIAKRAPSVSDIDGLSGDAQRQARADRVAAIRRARLWVNDREALARVFGEYADRFSQRPGGYTRIIRAGFRPGDNAEMAYIELVEAWDPSMAKQEAEAAAAESETRSADEEATVVIDDAQSDDGEEAVVEE